MASRPTKAMSNGSQSRSSSSFHFAAGLGSGILSACLLQPADLLKTRVQQSSSASLTVVFRAIARSQHPVRQLWRGTLPSALRTGFGSALYFSSLNALRQHVAQSNLLLAASGNASYGYAKYSSSSLPRLSNTANLATGAFARATVGFIMMPITVIKVCYESSLFSYKSIWGASTSILKTEGIKGFFSGFGAPAIRDAPYAGLYVLFYEQSKRRLSSLQEVPLLSQRVAPENSGMRNSTSASINFVSGVLAAGLATAITNPFDAVKTRLQLMPGKYGNMVKAGKQMVMEDGFRSLFDGLALRMGRKALSSALAWTLYEELIRRAEPKWKEKTETVL